MKQSSQSLHDVENKVMLHYFRYKKRHQPVALFEIPYSVNCMAAQLMATLATSHRLH